MKRPPGRGLISREGRAARDPGAAVIAAAPSRVELALLIVVLTGLGVSGIHPHDRLTWVLEVAPVLIAVPVLISTRRRFRLTPVAYALIAAPAPILALGGHYTYGEVPLGFWARDLLGLARNPYDRIGHFAQGFVPAIVAREILVRCLPLRPGAWLVVIVTSVCLAISRALRADRVGGGAAPRRGGGGLPGDAGRSVGHAHLRTTTSRGGLTGTACRRPACRLRHAVASGGTDGPATSANSRRGSAGACTDLVGE